MGIEPTITCLRNKALDRSCSVAFVLRVGLEPTLSLRNQRLKVAVLIPFALRSVLVLPTRFERAILAVKVPRVNQLLYGSMMSMNWYKTTKAALRAALGKRFLLRLLTYALSARPMRPQSDRPSYVLHALVQPSLCCSSLSFSVEAEEAIESSS